MKLEQQCVSLELAKKMKELGFEQESLFWWTKNRAGLKPYVEYEKFIDKRTVHHKYLDCSAYTVAELGEMLPYSIRSNLGIEEELFFTVHRCVGGRGWNLTYENAYDKTFERMPVWADTEADARAKMLIYLKENNLI